WGRPEVVESFLRSPESRYLPPQMRVSWPRQGYSRRDGSLDARLQFLHRFTKAMDEAGVPLLSGTDAPSIPGLVTGFALHRNLAALVEAGLTPHAALATATRTPGEFLRRHRPELPLSGVVSGGARADLLLVATDPLRDLATLTSPLGVIADGRWYPRDDVEARKADIRAAYAAAAASARDAASCAAPRSDPAPPSPPPPGRGMPHAAMPFWRSRASRLGSRPRKALKFCSALRLPPRERISRWKRASVSASCPGVSSNAA